MDRPGLCLLHQVHSLVLGELSDLELEGKNLPLFFSDVKRAVWDVLAPESRLRRRSLTSEKGRSSFV